MTQGKLEIHAHNILPIIKRWLYSDKDIFVRELISNACDAISKLKVLTQRDNTQLDGRIDVRIDTSLNQLIIEDNGLGMDRDELVRYLSQVAFSSAEEFLGHYQETSRDQIIGHFGLGFYSSFMVADQVRVESLSYKPGAEPASWSCAGGIDYELGVCERTEVGTRLILTINSESREYLEKEKLEKILTTYGRFLSYPIFLDGQPLPHQQPLWQRPSKGCSDEEYLEFYRVLYPGKPQPLFWVHLDVEHPFKLQGILYFPHQEEFQSQQDSIALYCNRVFVAQGCRDILPTYLLPLHGAIDSADLPLNVSRSALQMDRSVRQISSHIAKKVADKLKEIASNDPQRYQKVWPDVELIVKWGALEDEKFAERVEEVILWKNDKHEWTSLEGYLERAQPTHPKKVFYAQAQQLSSSHVRLYQEAHIEVIEANEVIDPPFFAHLEKKKGVEFCRVDAHLDPSLVRPEQHDASRSEQLSALFKEVVTMDVECQALANSHLPMLVTLDEQQRRFHEFMKRQKMDQTLFKPQGKAILNLNSPLVQAVEEIANHDRALAGNVLKRLLGLSQLSQEHLDAAQRQEAVEGVWELLAQLLQRSLS